MTSSEAAAIVSKLKKNPQLLQVLDNARHGSIRDLSELANFWREVPALFNQDVLEVFYTHLDEKRAPNGPNVAMEGTSAATRAYTSLLGLTHVGLFIQNKPGQVADTLLKHWPGIFKWSFYFFTTRVKPTTQVPKMRRSGMDVLSGVLYSICQEETVRQAVLATPGAIELQTFIWLFEETVSYPSAIDLPLPTMALDSLLRSPDETQLNRAMSASGDKPDIMAKLIIKRVKAEMDKPDIDPSRAMVFVDTLCKLSRCANHPLRHACLAQNAIGTVTKGLHALIRQQHNQQTDLLFPAIVGSFGYLFNCLESTDGFTWVSQSIRAGLLLALVNFSPCYGQLAPEEWQMILYIIDNILPRYLVYRSVINDVHAGLSVAQLSPHIADISQGLAKDAWETFVRVAEDRSSVEKRMAAFKGKPTVCDNSQVGFSPQDLGMALIINQCLKIAPKEQFRKCSACGTTNYCSKEGKKHNISKVEKAFIHNLSIRDARKHLECIREKAEIKSPGIPDEGIVICIDYTTQPESYDVELLESFKGLEIGGSANDEARNGALFDKVKKDPKLYTLIQTIIANGEYGQLLMTLAPSVWKLASDLNVDYFDEDGPTGAGDLSPEVD
ncbi:hypothetical protein HWV62_27486 [Athelia sp. TMB]|nr:hypothetical protein HWV62_27486 [Athelia sp. TMB]